MVLNHKSIIFDVQEVCYHQPNMKKNGFQTVVVLY